MDIAVVGAGVSGALTVDALLRSGLTVAVLDRRGPVNGSSPASTALLQLEIDKPLTHLIDKIGRTRAVRAYWRSATAIDALRARISDLQLRCSFRSSEASNWKRKKDPVSDYVRNSSAGGNCGNALR